MKKTIEIREIQNGWLVVDKVVYYPNGMLGGLVPTIKDDEYLATSLEEIHARINQLLGIKEDTTKCEEGK